jgi:hypothetical protein
MGGGLYSETRGEVLPRAERVERAERSEAAYMALVGRRVVGQKNKAP